MNELNDISLVVNMILGGLVPIIVNWLVETNWSKEVKTYIAVGVSTIFGSVISYALADGEIISWASFSLQIMAVATIVYNVFVSKLDVANELKETPSPLQPVIKKIQENKKAKKEKE